MAIHADQAPGWSSKKLGGNSSQKNNWQIQRMTCFFLLLPFLELPFCNMLLTNKCQFAEGRLLSHTSEPLSLCPSAPDTGLVAFCDNVTSLPGDLAIVPEQAMALCIAGDIKILNEQAFSSFPELHYLSITLKAPVISLGAFQSLAKLKYLSIHHSRTGCYNSSIPTQAFIKLYQLQALDMKGIDLTGQRGIILPSQLQSLAVSNCCFKNFSELYSIFPSLMWVPQVSVNNCETTKLPYSLSLGQQPNHTGFADPSSQSRKERLSLRAQKISLQSLVLSHSLLAFSELMALEIKKLDSLTMVKTNHLYEKNETYRICALASHFSLRSLIFSQNDYKSFDSQELPDCYSMENLVLQENKMEKVDPFLLYKLPYLQLLDLSGNHLLWELCPLEYGKRNFTSKLRILNFSGNRFNLLQSETFSCLPCLETLSLNDCGLEKIPVSAFSTLTDLKVLNLRNNRLTKLANVYFYNLSRLVSLDLHGNPIEIFPKTAFQNLTSLRELQIGSDSGLPDIFFSVPGVTVFGMMGNYAFFYTVVTTAFASVQNMSLSGCYNFEKAQEHSLFPSVQLLHWEPALHACTSSKPFHQHFPQLEKLIYKYNYNDKDFLANHFNLSHLPKLRILEVHNLPEVVFNSSPIEAQYFFMDLPQLEALRIVNSNILYISADFFKNKSNLRLLVLENEVFLALDIDIQDEIMHSVQLRYLQFSNVTFRCDCSTAWLIVWASRKKGIFVSGLEQSQCLDVQLREKKFHFLTFIEQNRSQDDGLLLFIVTFTLLFLLISVPILNATWGSEFLFLAYMLRAWWHGLLNRKRSINFEYDAFVSYSSQDQEWVLQHLVPNLEQVGPPFLKLCLHNRDFIVGKAIVDNIMESLYSSHKTICVVSQHALKSYWCSMEMSFATYRLMAEREDRLILLFMEHIPRYQLSAYHRLAKLVKRKAYLDWPKEPAAQSAFWDKLRNILRER